MFDLCQEQYDCHNRPRMMQEAGFWTARERDKRTRLQSSLLPGVSHTLEGKFLKGLRYYSDFLSSFRRLTDGFPLENEGFFGLRGEKERTASKAKISGQAVVKAEPSRFSPKIIRDLYVFISG